MSPATLAALATLHASIGKALEAPERSYAVLSDAPQQLLTVRAAVLLDLQRARLREQVNAIEAERAKRMAERQAKEAKASAERPRATHGIKYNGRTMTMRAWAAELGIGYTTLSERLRSGWSVEAALTTRVIKGPSPHRKNAVALTLNGKTQCARAWARETGLPYTTIRNRRGRGWTDEQILTTPLDVPRSERVKAEHARAKRPGTR